MEEQIHINAKGNIIDILKQMKAGFEANSKSADSFQKTAVGSLDKITSSLKNINLAALNQNIQNLGQGFEELNRPGLDFNSNLHDLSAITGLTGDQLAYLGEKARESTKEFGGTASDSLNTYKTILSRLGPDIAKTPAALEHMERNVRVLSKTMGGDAQSAVMSLTSAMLQYGVDMSNPIEAAKKMEEMMNVMAAGAQQGAVEVKDVAAGLVASGTAAKQAKLSFSETNAALQLLTPKMNGASEAGTGLRNILGKMAGEDVIPKEAAEKLKRLGVDMSIVSDTSIPFTDRLRELKKAQGDATIMAQVFGTENAAAANILLDSVDAQDELRDKITGTNTAQEQANIVMESASEKLARMQAKIDDAKIAFFEMTGGMTVYLGPATEVLRTLTSLTPIYTATKTAVLALATAQGRAALAEKLATAGKLIGAAATKVVTAATWLWNAALSANPIGLVIVAVAALAVGVYALSKAFSNDTAAEKLNAEVKQKVIDKTADQRAELTLLFETLKSAKKGSEEYNDTLKELEKMQPGIVDKYNLQAGAIKDINAAQAEMIRNIDALAKAEAWKEVAKEQYKEAFKKQAEGPGLIEDWQSYVLMGGVSAEEINQRKANEHKVNAEIANREYFKSTQTEAYKNAKSSAPNNEIADAESISASASSPTLGTPSGYSSSRSSSSASSSSGSVKSVTAHIQSLMSGNIVIYAQNVKEGAAEIRKIFTEQLVGVVRDLETGAQ